MTGTRKPKDATRATRPRARDWAPKFLGALASHPDVSKASAAAGIARSTAYRRCQTDEDFATAWTDALDVSLDALEAALFARAIETDTRAAEILLRAHRPEKYADRHRVEHTGKVDTSPSLDLGALTEEELREYRDLTARATPKP